MNAVQNELKNLKRVLRQSGISLENKENKS